MPDRNYTVTLNFPNGETLVNEVPTDEVNLIIERIGLTMGPPGPDGPEGPVGPQGPAGPGGYNKVVVVPTAAIFDSLQPQQSEILLHIEGMTHNYVVPEPVVSIPAVNGNKLGTSATVTTDGTVTITTNTSVLSGELGVTHYMVKLDNMLGKTLTARRSAYDPRIQEGGDPAQWQMAWSVDPDVQWYPFDSYANVSGMMTAVKNTPMEHNTVYVARRPVFTTGRWNNAIARWRNSVLTSPTNSGDVNFVVGNLPAVAPHAPAMDIHGFKFGTGPAAVVLTGVIHVDEHTGAYAMEALVDWLLSNDADAAYLRNKCTFYVYPNVNPQALYAGASRNELTTGDNANRIWKSTGFDHVPLSLKWRAVWTADLPSTISGNIDFHDAARGAGYGMTYDHVATSGTIMGHLMAEYYERYALVVDRNPGGTTTGVDGGIARYLRETFNGNWMITAEHLMSLSHGVPEWQAWGRMLGRAMRDLYDTDGTAKWKVPPWQAAGNTVVNVMTYPEGSALVTAPTGTNPAMAFQMPVGKTIDVLLDLTVSGNNGLFVRQADTLALALATSTELYKRTSGTNQPLTRMQRAVYDATKPWFGLIIASSGGTNPAIRATPMTRYREVTP